MVGGGGWWEEVDVEGSWVLRAYPAKTDRVIGVLLVGVWVQGQVEPHCCCVCRPRPLHHVRHSHTERRRVVDLRLQSWLRASGLATQ